MFRVPDARRAHCHSCGKHRDAAGPISWSGLCSVCAHRRFNDNADGISEGVGPWAEKRRYGYARYVLGPRVALALKQAGVFDADLLDATTTTSQTGA